MALTLEEALITWLFSNRHLGALRNSFSCGHNGTGYSCGLCWLRSQTILAKLLRSPYTHSFSQRWVCVVKWVRQLLDSNSHLCSKRPTETPHLQFWYSFYLLPSSLPHYALLHLSLTQPSPEALSAHVNSKKTSIKRGWALRGNKTWLVCGWFRSTR